MAESSDSLQCICLDEGVSDKLVQTFIYQAQLEEIPYKEHQGLESIGGQSGSNSQGFHYTSLLIDV